MELLKKYTNHPLPTPPIGLATPPIAAPTPPDALPTPPIALPGCIPLGADPTTIGDALPALGAGYVTFTYINTMTLVDAEKQILAHTGKPELAAKLAPKLLGIAKSGGPLGAAAAGVGVAGAFVVYEWFTSGGMDDGRILSTTALPPCPGR